MYYVWMHECVCLNVCFHVCMEACMYMCISRFRLFVAEVLPYFLSTLAYMNT